MYGDQQFDFEQANRLKRVPDVHLTITNALPSWIDKVRLSMQDCQPIWVSTPGGDVYGLVMKLTPRVTNYLINDHNISSSEVDLTLRPVQAPERDPSRAQFFGPGADYAHAEWIKGIRRSSEITFPVHFLEDDMKVYEAVVTKLDPNTNEATEISKVVAPFLAKNAAQAREAVLVDYAKEAGLTGKDLAGYAVRVREFCTSSGL